jgi:hypothetical protein
MSNAPKRYTSAGLNVEPIEGTLRDVAGGRCVDIRINDPRSTITSATVNAANVIDQMGWPYGY